MCRLEGPLDVFHTCNNNMQDGFFHGGDNDGAFVMQNWPHCNARWGFS